MLTGAELEQYKKQLKQLAEKAATDKTLEDFSSPELEPFKLASPVGRCLYESFSEEELKGILIEFHSANNRNPTQKDIFIIYKQYIRARFGNWPWALQAAGLKEKKKKPPAKRMGRYRNARENSAGRRR